MTDKLNITGTQILKKIENAAKQRYEKQLHQTLKSGMIKFPKTVNVMGVQYKISRLPGRLAMFDCDELEICLGKEPVSDFWQFRNFCHEVIEATFEENMCRFYNANKEIFFFCTHDQFTAICSSVASTILEVIKLNQNKDIHK